MGIDSLNEHCFRLRKIEGSVFATLEVSRVEVNIGGCAS